VFDTNHDGVVNSSDTVVAGYKSMADGVDKLLTGQDGVVDDFTTQVCIPDKNSKCTKANSCLVVVVNTSNTAEEVCLDSPVELCYMGYPLSDSRCYCDDGVTLKTANSSCPVVCPDGTTANSSGECICPDGVTVWTTGVTCPGVKTVTDRVWYRLVNPPHP